MNIFLGRKRTRVAQGPSQTRAGVRTRIIRVSSRNNDPRTRPTDVRTHISVGACTKAHTRANIGASSPTHARTSGGTLFRRIARWCRSHSRGDTAVARGGNGALLRERDRGGTGGYQLVGRGCVCADRCGRRQEAAGMFILVGFYYNCSSGFNFSDASATYSAAAPESSLPEGRRVKEERKVRHSHFS